MTAINSYLLKEILIIVFKAWTKKYYIE